MKKILYLYSLEWPNHSLVCFIISLLCDVIAWTHENKACRLNCFSLHIFKTQVTFVSLFPHCFLVSSSSPPSFSFLFLLLVLPKDSPRELFTFTFWRQSCRLKFPADYTSGLGLFSCCFFDIMSYKWPASTGLCWLKSLFFLEECIV